MIVQFFKNAIQTLQGSNPPLLKFSYDANVTSLPVVDGQAKPFCKCSKFSVQTKRGGLSLPEITLPRRSRRHRRRHFRRRFLTSRVRARDLPERLLNRALHFDALAVGAGQTAAALEAFRVR